MVEYDTIVNIQTLPKKGDFKDYVTKPSKAEVIFIAVVLIKFCDRSIFNLTTAIVSGCIIKGSLMIKKLFLICKFV